MDVGAISIIYITILLTLSLNDLITLFLMSPKSCATTLMLGRTGIAAVRHLIFLVSIALIASMMPYAVDMSGFPENKKYVYIGLVIALVGMMGYYAYTKLTKKDSYSFLIIPMAPIDIQTPCIPKPNT